MGQSTEELTSQIEDTRGRMASDLDALQDKVSPSAIVQRRKEATRNRISSMRDKVMGTAHSAGGTVSDKVPSPSGVASSVQGGVQSGVSSAQDRVQGSPLAAGVVAFGAGMVIASLLPASKVEAEAAHRVVETAKDKGQPLLDEAKEAGQQLGQDLKERATDAAQQVKDTAADSAQQVKGEAQSSAQTVKSEAKPSNG
jgi:gas vesicle protein